ncbi:MAG: sigma factor-like helix-turn-helix DNA-binding protein [Geminicoccaceae bacterium]
MFQFLKDDGSSKRRRPTDKAGTSPKTSSSSAINAPPHPGAEDIPKPTAETESPAAAPGREPTYEEELLPDGAEAEIQAETDDTEPRKAEQPPGNDLSTPFPPGEEPDEAHESFIEIFDHGDDKSVDMTDGERKSERDDHDPPASDLARQASASAAIDPEPPSSSDVDDENFIEIFDHTDEPELLSSTPRKPAAEPDHGLDGEEAVGQDFTTSLAAIQASLPAESPAAGKRSTEPFAIGDPPFPGHQPSEGPLSSPTSAVRSSPNPEPHQPIPDHLLSTLVMMAVPRLRRLAMVMLGDDAKADQLVQMTVERALAEPSALQPDVDLVIALFALLHEMRNQLRRPSGEALPDAAGNLAAAPRFEATLFRYLSGADRDELREAARAMAGLTEQERVILLLIALENLRYRDVAIVIKVPFGRVMAHVARAREKLRQALLWHEHGGDEQYDESRSSDGQNGNDQNSDGQDSNELTA